MSPAYKLTYFDGRGIAETSRFLMKYGGIEFEDIRIKIEDWPQVKNRIEFGQLPLLERNGKTVNQSLAINRYLAKQVKLIGNNDWENLEIDAVVDTIKDCLSKLPSYYEPDEIKKKTLIETFKNEVMPFYLTRLESLNQKNNGFMAVGEMTWADFYWATVSPYFDLMTGCDCLANYPNLKALREKINDIPVIKKWIEIRPKTDF